MKWFLDNLLPVLIGVAFTGIIGGIPVYRYYDGRISSLTAENTALSHELSNAKKSISRLNNDIELAIKNKEQLLEQHEILEGKYARCTRTDGITYFCHSIDTRWHESKFETGQSIRFKLTSSSLYLKFTRVSKSGPIISIFGCNSPIIIEGFESKENEHRSFLLNENNRLKIYVSSKICSMGSSAKDLGDVEKIEISCIEYDTDGQYSIVRFRKIFSDKD